MKRSAILVVLMLLSLTATCQFHLTPVNSQEAARLKRQTGWDSNSERKSSSKTSYRVNVKEVTIQPYSKEMLMRAKAGNITAQRELAICYFRGLGINKNYQKAAKWLMIAALNGDVDAMVYVKLTSTKGYCQYYPDDLNNITNELQRFTSEQIAMAKYHYYTYMETDVNKQEKYLMLAARKNQPDTKSVLAQHNNRTSMAQSQTSQQPARQVVTDNKTRKQEGIATTRSNMDTEKYAQLILNNTYICEDVRSDDDLSTMFALYGIRKQETYTFMPNHKLIRTKKMIVPSLELLSSELVWRYKQDYEGTQELYYSVEGNQISIILKKAGLAPLTMSIGYNGGYLNYTSYYKGNINIKGGTKSTLRKPKGNSWVGRIYRQNKMEIINPKFQKILNKPSARGIFGCQIEFVSDKELVLQMSISAEYTGLQYRKEINSFMGNYQENVPPDTYIYTIKDGVVKTNYDPLIIRIQNGGESLFVNLENFFQGVLKRIQ